MCQTTLFVEEREQKAQNYAFDWGLDLVYKLSRSRQELAIKISVCQISGLSNEGLGL